MTREEFEALLEEAFIEGYNDAIDEIFEEDNTFDLEDEYDYYNESSKFKKELNKARLQHALNHDNRFSQRGVMGGYTDNNTGKELDQKGRSKGWTDERAHDTIKRQLLRKDKPSKFNQKFQLNFVKQAGRQFGGDGNKYAELIKKRNLTK